MPIARTMQILGYALVAAAGMLRVLGGGDADPWPWLLSYLTLAVAFHVGAGAPADLAHRRRRLAALAVMAVAMVAMAAIRPCPYGALTLVVVASQAALVLTPRTAAIWVAAQTLVVAFCLVPALGWVLGGAEIIALVGFQAFAVAAIASARREAEARAALAHTQERTRIARDLHDVLGHNLTALGLQLEIAAHVDAEAARTHTAKARELTSRLLEDVRAVVAAMRAEPAPTIAARIRAVVADAPGPAIHVDAPDSLVIEDGSRADCIVRCVQEIVTNTRRHARGAENVWIRLRRDGDELVVEARDDGKGAAALGDGQGLRGMRSRFQELGGGVEVGPVPGHAFALNARLPLRAAGVAS